MRSGLEQIKCGVTFDVFPDDRNMFIPILSGLLMIESQSVNMFVGNAAPTLGKAATGQFNFLPFPLISNLRSAGVVWLYNCSIALIIVRLVTE